MPHLSHPKIGIIIQARMMSTRLHGKVLARVTENDVMLECVINRLKLTKIPNIFVATSVEFPDDVIAKFCQEHCIQGFRGSENDVLERYYEAATHYKLDIILRVTADCPLIDPEIVNQVLDFFLSNPNDPYDYVSNVIERTFPRGMDIEVFSYRALTAAHTLAQTKDEREHVTAYIYGHPKDFKIGSYKHLTHDYSKYRLTVDTKEDLDLIRKIYKELNQKVDPLRTTSKYAFNLDQIVEILKQHPEWLKINSHIEQKFYSSKVYANSLKLTDVSQLLPEQSKSLDQSDPVSDLETKE